jgi:hypothetical protein
MVLPAFQVRVSLRAIVSRTFATQRQRGPSLARRNPCRLVFVCRRPRLREGDGFREGAGFHFARLGLDDANVEQAFEFLRDRVLNTSVVSNK